MSKTIKRLTAATQARIEAVEKLDDFMQAIDEIVKDFEKRRNIQKPAVKHTDKLHQLKRNS